MDCGPTCLRMIAAYHGRFYSLHFMRERSYLDREGVSLRGIAEAAEDIGMETMSFLLPFEKKPDVKVALVDIPLPCIVHWNQNHFVVVYRIESKYVWVADPASGKIKLSIEEFKRHWYSKPEAGIAMALAPTPTFFERHEYGDEKIQPGFGYLFSFLRPYRRLLWQLGLGLVAAAVIQLLFPFLTQSIVDIGIDQQNLHFVSVALMAMLALFLGETIINLLQGWILLHIGTRVNVSLMGFFLTKLMRLPIAYFDSKSTGDLLQRIYDQRRIEQFLTNATLSALFSVFTLFILSLVLAWYNIRVFLIFVFAALLYGLWIAFFLKRRAHVDHLRFREQTANQNALLELLEGMPEIKLQGSEQRRRWAWTAIQGRLFQANVKFLTLTQYQDSGAQFISQLKDIIITFVAARSVIAGELSLGMMLAIQYIIGQMNMPLRQLAQFVRTAQEASISLERLGEIQAMEDEQEQEKNRTSYLPAQADLHLDQVSFQYNKLSPLVLDQISLTIPYAKVTAIVGASGSGKTTLLKLLLGFYEPTNGQIRVGNTPLTQISRRTWRRHCGAVLQDGFLFSDSIERNIAECDDRTDQTRLQQATHIAHIQPFIQQLPLGYQTKIGAQGNGLSQGQRQRLLIARAIYKNPDIIFFDEATNALDADNEKVIMENMASFYQGRTVVVVAHRLSTVRNADQIVVLHQGQIVEKGTHEELSALKGAYYQLVKNQLELGT